MAIKKYTFPYESPISTSVELSISTDVSTPPAGDFKVSSLSSKIRSFLESAVMESAVMSAVIGTGGNFGTSDG